MCVCGGVSLSSLKISGSLHLKLAQVDYIYGWLVMLVHGLADDDDDDIED